MQVERMRGANPDDELVIVFDIEGTIVDTRYFVVHALLAFDRARGTEHFRGITVNDVVEHETRIDQILDSFRLPEEGTRRRRRLVSPSSVGSR